MIKFFKRILSFLGILVAAALLFVLCLTLTEYRPEDRSLAEISTTSPQQVFSGQQVRLLSWNTGYAGLGEQSDFFMDGGKMVDPPSKDNVQENMKAIGDYLSDTEADFYLLQELDRSSSRTDRVDQAAYYEEQTGLPWSYGANYRCFFVPYPFPPLGKMDSGIATFSPYQTSKDPIRLSLPCPFSWPVRVANMKRCVLMNTYDLEGTDKKLVVVNLHLEAYDDGEGKIAQTKKLFEILEGEYKKEIMSLPAATSTRPFPAVWRITPIRAEICGSPAIWKTAFFLKAGSSSTILPCPPAALWTNPMTAATQITSSMCWTDFWCLPTSSPLWWKPRIWAL